MKLPKAGRVVVIDDKKEEGIPLVKALVKNGYLSTFFSDQQED